MTELLFWNQGTRHESNGCISKLIKWLGFISPGRGRSGKLETLSGGVWVSYIPWSEYSTFVIVIIQNLTLVDCIPVFCNVFVLNTCIPIFFSQICYIPIIYFFYHNILAVHGKPLRATSYCLSVTCGSRKYPYPPTKDVYWKFQGEKPKLLKERMNQNQNFQWGVGGGGVKHKNPPDILWNNTFCKGQD